MTTTSELHDVVMTIGTINWTAVRLARQYVRRCIDPIYEAEMIARELGEGTLLDEHIWDAYHSAYHRVGKLFGMNGDDMVDMVSDAALVQATRWFKATHPEDPYDTDC